MVVLMYSSPRLLAERVVKALADSVAEAIYESVLLAMGVEAIEDYKKHPDRYLVNEEIEEFIDTLLKEKEN